jgi:hypothetical protein
MSCQPRLALALPFPSGVFSDQLLNVSESLHTPNCGVLPHVGTTAKHSGIG